VLGTLSGVPFLESGFFTDARLTVSSSGLPHDLPEWAASHRETSRLASWPERDWQALSELAVGDDVKEYPQAGHSFMNRINTGPVLNPLVRMVAMNYHHASAEDSWRRILTFFDQHLGRDPATS